MATCRTWDKRHGVLAAELGRLEDVGLYGGHGFAVCDQSRRQLNGCMQPKLVDSHLVAIEGPETHRAAGFAPRTRAYKNEAASASWSVCSQERAMRTCSLRERQRGFLGVVVRVHQRLGCCTDRAVAGGSLPAPSFVSCATTWLGLSLYRCRRTRGQSKLKQAEASCAVVVGEVEVGSWCGERAILWCCGVEQQKKRSRSVLAGDSSPRSLVRQRQRAGASIYSHLRHAPTMSALGQDVLTKVSTKGAAS